MAPPRQRPRLTICDPSSDAKLGPETLINAFIVLSGRASLTNPICQYWDCYYLLPFLPAFAPLLRSFISQSRNRKSPSPSLGGLSPSRHCDVNAAGGQLIRQR